MVATDVIGERRDYGLIWTERQQRDLVAGVVGVESFILVEEVGNEKSLHGRPAKRREIQILASSRRSTRGLRETFPASDAVSLTEPAGEERPASRRGRRKRPFSRQ